MTEDVGATRLSLLIGVVLLVGLASGINASGNPVAGYPPVYPAYVEHEAIEIGSDDDFTEENGVVRGSGTRLDPYRLESLIIKVSSGTIPVYVHDTSVCFRVGHVKFQFTDESVLYSHEFTGMKFERCSNGVVIDNFVESSFIGIMLVDCNEFRLFRNQVHGMDEGYSRGISVMSCANTNLTENILEDWGYAIWAQESDWGRVEENIIWGARIGISLIDCSSILIGSNTFYQTVTSYSDDSWTDNIWLESETVTEGDLGLMLLLGVVVPAEAVLSVLGYIRIRRRPRDR